MEQIYLNVQIEYDENNVMYVKVKKNMTREELKEVIIFLQKIVDGTINNLDFDRINLN